MKVYLILDAVVFLVPFLMSFEKRINYRRHWSCLFPAIISVGTMFFCLDILATARGDWGFNRKYLVGIFFAGIPLEEIIFFIVVPYSCIFIYEAVATFRKDSVLNIPRWSFSLIASVLIVSAFGCRIHGYTTVVLSLCALSFLAMIVANSRILQSQNYWLFIALTYIPFLLMNSTLTSVPVVLYTPSAILGIRFMTIPLEDFFYSYAFLSLNFLIYFFFQDRVKRQDDLRKLAQELSGPHHVV